MLDTHHLLLLIMHEAGTIIISILNRKLNHTDVK